MNFKTKADSLAKKMNSISETLDLSDEMIIEGNDIIEYVEEKTQDVQLYEGDSDEGDVEQISPADMINLNNMVDDFKYVRDTLKEQTNNARRVLNTITLDLLDSDDDKRASLVMSFAELNRALVQAQDLFIKSYKEMANVLLSIDKINGPQTPGGTTITNNTLNINSTDATPINTVDLIAKMNANN